MLAVLNSGRLPLVLFLNTSSIGVLMQGHALELFTSKIA